MTLKKFQEFL